MIEQRGMAAAVICTEQFASSARMTAQTFGMHGYPMQKFSIRLDASASKI
jgi:hypothetical protein